MTDPRQDPVDQTRTHQPRAGVAMKDTRGLPGYLLMALAVLALVICLTAAATGHEGATIGAGTVAILTAAAGTVWVFAERRRVVRLARHATTDSTQRRGTG